MQDEDKALKKLTWIAVTLIIVLALLLNNIQNYVDKNQKTDIKRWDRPLVE